MSTERSMNRESTKIAVLLCIGLSLPILYISYWFLGTEPEAKTDFASTHSELTQELTTLSYLVFEPGKGTNPNRHDLHRILEVILAGRITDDKRYELANTGLVLLRRMEAGLTDLAHSREELHDTANSLETTISKIRQPSDRNIAQEALTHTQEQLTIIESIILALETMNEESILILERIIQDQGALTPHHIAAINARTEIAEDNFDTLSEKYLELEKLLQNTN